MLLPSYPCPTESATSFADRYRTPTTNFHEHAGRSAEAVSGTDPRMSDGTTSGVLRHGPLYASTRGGRSRGWVVTAAGFGINLALGVLYTWSVFAKALTAEWGWTAAQASFPYSVAVAFFALVTAFAGRLQDRIGPRWVATAGGALMGLGMIVASLAGPGNGTPLILGFGVLTGSGIAMGFVSTFPAAAKWFPETRRGLITGIVVAGFGIASVYIAPLTQALLRAYGISGTFRSLGLAFLVATVLLAQLISNPPEGYDPGPNPRPDVLETTCPPAKRERDWHEAIRTRQFWLLWLMYGLTAFAGVMIIGHMAEIEAKQVMGPDLGYLLVAILAIGNASGRIVAGVVSDRIGSVRTMRIVFLLQTIVMLLLGLAHSVLVLAVLGFMVGFDYGSDLSLFPCTVSEYFGPRNQGVNYGLVFTSWGVGGVFGALTAGAIVDATGSFVPAYVLAATLCALAVALTFLTRAPEPI
jgi:MFS transporter, OFA family, oxalate/formate antiporter